MPLHSADLLYVVATLVVIFILFLGRKFFEGLAKQAGVSTWEKISPSHSSGHENVDEDAVVKVLREVVDTEELARLMIEYQTELEETDNEHRKTVFISYAYEDASIANRFADKLEKRSYDTLTVKEDISIGDDMRQRFIDFIHGSDLMIVLLTGNEINSYAVLSELEVAVTKRESDSDFLVIPVSFGNHGPLFDLEDFLYIDANSVDDAVKKVDKAVKTYFRNK